MPFVTWDRYVVLVDAVETYGWIDREDSYKDFVCLFFYADGEALRQTLVFPPLPRGFFFLWTRL